VIFAEWLNGAESVKGVQVRVGVLALRTMGIPVQ
jgi:hypothetical protein